MTQVQEVFNKQYKGWVQFQGWMKDARKAIDGYMDSRLTHMEGYRDPKFPFEGIMSIIIRYTPEPYPVDDLLKLIDHAVYNRDITVPESKKLSDFLKDIHVIKSPIDIPESFRTYDVNTKVVYDWRKSNAIKQEITATIREAFRARLIGPARRDAMIDFLKHNTGT